MEIIAASIALSLIGILVKTTAGFASPIYVIWFRSLLHIIFLTPFIFKYGFRIELRKEAFLRGLTGFIGMGLYFLSLQQLPLAIATSVFWCAPIFTLLLVHLKERKKLSAPETLSVLTILSGIILLAAQPGSSSESVPFLFLLVALISSLGIGASYYFLGAMARAKESPLSITYSFSYLIFIFASPLAVPSTPHFTLGIAAALMGIAGLAILYQFLITRAYAKNSTDQAATLQATIIPLISVCADRIWFHHSLNITCAIALLLLIAGQALKTLPAGILQATFAETRSK